jgi:2-iminobutanoate/2-iminopropanoate deaminase
MEVSVTKRQIVTTSAPAAMAVYSQAIDAGGFVFCAGQVGMDPVTRALAEGGVQAEAERALRNLAGVLDAAGLGLADVVKTTCFLTDIADFPAFNEVYARFFPEQPPARSTFAVAALPGGARIEVEAIAARPSV